MRKLLRPTIRHILAKGEGRGGFVALALPHHVHTRDKKKEMQTLSCDLGTQHRTVQVSTDSKPGEKSLHGTGEEIWNN